VSCLFLRHNIICYMYIKVCLRAKTRHYICIARSLTRKLEYELRLKKWRPGSRVVWIELRHTAYRAIVLIELWSAGHEPVSTEAREHWHRTPPQRRRPLLPNCLPAGAISADPPANYSGALLGRASTFVSDLLKGCQSIGNKRTGL